MSNQTIFQQALVMKSLESEQPVADEKTPVEPIMQCLDRIVRKILNSMNEELLCNSGTVAFAEERNKLGNESDELWESWMLSWAQPKSGIDAGLDGLRPLGAPDISNPDTLVARLVVQAEVSAGADHLELICGNCVSTIHLNGHTRNEEGLATTVQDLIELGFLELMEEKGWQIVKAATLADAAGSLKSFSDQSGTTALTESTNRVESEITESAVLEQLPHR